MDFVFFIIIILFFWIYLFVNSYFYIFDSVYSVGIKCAVIDGILKTVKHNADILGQWMYPGLKFGK